ncbi:hypothetical protein AAK967_05740 [Atopobiaceae bacterium 24-176]
MSNDAKGRPRTFGKCLWWAQFVAAVALAALTFVVPLHYSEIQATETLRWCLDERAEPGSWRPAVVRTLLTDASALSEDPTVANVASVVVDRERSGSALPRRTILSLDAPPGIPSIWYYLQEGPLEPLYGPGLWIVSVDMSQAVATALFSGTIAACAASVWLVAFYGLLRKERRRMEAEERGLRARYVLGAHNVKEPLMAIQGCMEAVEDGTMTAEDSSGIVHEEIHRIQSLVEDLGRLAWVEDGTIPVKMQVLDLWPYVSGEAAASAWSKSEPSHNGLSLAWADAALTAQSLATVSDWMTRYGLHPHSIALEGDTESANRAQRLVDRVHLTIRFDRKPPANAARDASLDLLSHIQALQEGAAFFDGDTLALSWHPAPDPRP